MVTASCPPPKLPSGWGHFFHNTDRDTSEHFNPITYFSAKTGHRVALQSFLPYGWAASPAIPACALALPGRAARTPAWADRVGFHLLVFQGTHAPVAHTTHILTLRVPRD